MHAMTPEGRILILTRYTHTLAVDPVINVIVYPYFAAANSSYLTT